MDDSPLSLLLDSGAGPWLAALWGALWGSFANVVIERLPRGESVMRPASHCLACGAPIRWYDNIPLLSYLLLRGRCRRCRARFSPRYFLVEALGVLLGLQCFQQAVVAGEGSPALRLASFFLLHLFATALVAVVFIDLRTMIIPDGITLSLLLGLGPAAVALGRVTWQDAVVGAAAGFVPIWLLRELWLRLRGVEGIGLGDAKLLAAVGGVLGWQALPVVVLLGSVQGLLVAIPLRLTGRSMLAKEAYQGTAVKAAGEADPTGPGAAGSGGASSAVSGAAGPGVASSAVSGAAGSGGASSAESGAAGPDAPGPAEAAAGGVEEAPTEGGEGRPLEYDEVPAGAVPFGPFLAVAALEYLLWGKALADWMAGNLDILVGTA